MVFHYPRACDQKDSPLMGETERIKWGLITEKLGKGSIYQQTSYQLSHPMQELWPQLHWLQILHQSLVVWLMLARSLEFVSGKNLCLPSCSPEKRLHRHCQQMQATLSKNHDNFRIKEAGQWLRRHMMKNWLRTPDSWNKRLPGGQMQLSWTVTNMRPGTCLPGKAGMHPIITCFPCNSR